MCGHVGVFGGKISYKLCIAFEDLLNLDLMRGRDSTGVAFIKNSGKVLISKDAVLPYELVREKVYDTHIHAVDNWGLIGHNRAATKGKVSSDNAHPFEVGDIVLAHNGTLDAQWRLPDSKEFDSDSHNLTYAIDKLGIDKAWELVEGAATIVFYNKKDRTLNMVCNGQRPFHYILVKGGTQIMWASEENTLKQVMVWRGIDSVGKGTEIQKLERHRLYTFSVGKKGGLNVSDRMLTPGNFQVANFRGRTSAYIHKGRAGYWDKGTFIEFSDQTGWGTTEDDDSPWLDQFPARGGKSEGNVLPLVLPAPDKKASTINIDDALKATAEVLKTTFKGDAPGRMTEEEFQNTYSKCVFCESSLEHEFECAMIVDSKTAVCNDCRHTAFNSGIEIRP